MLGKNSFVEQAACPCAYGLQGSRIAPTGRHSIAQGSAPWVVIDQSPNGAKCCRQTSGLRGSISPRWGFSSIWHDPLPGRCPGLLHRAPLELIRRTSRQHSAFWTQSVRKCVRHAGAWEPGLGKSCFALSKSCFDRKRCCFMWRKKVQTAPSFASGFSRSNLIGHAGRLPRPARQRGTRNDSPVLFGQPCLRFSSRQKQVFFAQPVSGRTSGF